MKTWKPWIFNVATIVVMGLFLAAQGVGAWPGAGQIEPQAEPLAPSATSQAVISYQGTLTDKSGNPLNQTVTMEFALYDAAAGGNRLWGPETQSVAVSEGLFHILLGSVVAIDPANLTEDLYLDITVNGEEMLPRELLTSVAQAGVASTLFPGATIGGDLNVEGGDIKFDNGRGLIAAHGGKLMTGPGGRTWQTWPGSAAAYSFVANDANGDAALVVEGTGNVTIDGDLGMYGNLNMNRNDITDLDGIQLPFKLESERSWEFKTYGSGGSTATVLQSTVDDKDFQFRNPNSSVILTIRADNDSGGYLNMNGNSIANCGALTEANLQTKEELAAERIERFEEGDVLCWAGERLEKCATAGDPLVQAVADAEGRPIVIGAELVKVLGPVRYGDLLVASDVAGYAMVDNDPRPGAVIAQALEDFEGEKGIIKAMIRKF